MNSIIQTPRGTQVLLRLAEDRDANSITQAIDSVAGEGTWLMTNQFVWTPPWGRALEQDPASSRYLLMVAEVEGQIIGWCRVFPYEFGENSRHVGDLGIGITAPWREQGVGTHLLSATIDTAKSEQYAKLTLSVFSTNIRAIHVFEKVGFKQTGVRYKQFQVQSEYVDEVLMERFLVN